jgi:hypothetical protein
MASIGQFPSAAQDRKGRSPSASKDFQSSRFPAVIDRSQQNLQQQQQLASGNRSIDMGRWLKPDVRIRPFLFFL